MSRAGEVAGSVMQITVWRSRILHSVLERGQGSLGAFDGRFSRHEKYMDRRGPVLIQEVTTPIKEFRIPITHDTIEIAKGAKYPASAATSTWSAPSSTGSTRTATRRT